MQSIKPLQRLLKNLFGVFLIAWLLPALACNFPQTRPPMKNISAKELHQTLAAQLEDTPSANAPNSSVPSSPVPAVATSYPPLRPASSPPPELTPTSDGIYNYLTQSGDTLTAIANRFNVEVPQIISNSPLPTTGYLPVASPLWIPINPDLHPEPGAIFPDSETIFSPTSLDFNIETFVSTAGGFLNTYTEVVDGQSLSGAEIIARVASESSVNPRLLLAFLEQRSGWVFDPAPDRINLDYPIGFRVSNRRGLYQELVMAATHLNIGYYGWRTGELHQIKFADGSLRAINPWLNPGSVGVQNLFAKFYTPKTWTDKLYGAQNFPDFYRQTFGDPWERAAKVEPLLTPELVQPAMELPFSPGERWSLSGGPHASWNTGSPRGALDFAPVTGEPPCSVSRAWVTAAAPGVAARSANNVVALDLDGDGNEQTGWVLVYLHVADTDRLSSGQTIRLNEPIGHPSCDRGQSTGTHVHIARKYNGEWLPADIPLPWVLGGWQTQAGLLNYQGSLNKGDKTVTASPLGIGASVIVR